MRHSRKALTLPELLLAILVAGLTVAMVLRMVGQIRTTSSLIGDRSRKEGWQSFVDQIAQAGIDPSQAPLFREHGAPTNGQGREGVVSIAAVATTMPGFVRTTQADSTGRVGEVGLTRLLIQHEDVVEARPVGFGFMLGQGAAVPARLNPVLPLPPVALGNPTISPANGARLTLANVVPQAGAPSTVVLQATQSAADPAGMSVYVEVLTPVALSEQASGTASTSVSLVALASGLTARAWVEYPGGAGDTPILMPDGIRRTWRTRVGGRALDYVPSDLMTYDFRLRIGAPVLTHLGTEYPVSAAVSADWFDRLAIEQRVPLVATGEPASSAIEWPASTQVHFGGRWPLAGVHFTTSFNGVAGPSDGALNSFFSTGYVALPGFWAATFPVTAQATLPGWLVSDRNVGSEPTYSWTMQNAMVALEAPGRTTAPGTVLDAIDTFATGGGPVVLRWGAPTDAPTGKPYVLSSAHLGNAAANTGAVWTVSTGPEISVTIP